MKKIIVGLLAFVIIFSIMQTRQFLVLDLFEDEEENLLTYGEDTYRKDEEEIVLFSEESAIEPEELPLANGNSSFSPSGRTPPPIASDDLISKIEGTTFLHKVWNVLVQTTERSEQGLPISVLLGLNSSESEYHEGSWVPFTGIENLSLFKDIDEALLKNGYMHIKPWTGRGKVSEMDAMGPFQILPNAFGGNGSFKPRTASEEDWRNYTKNAVGLTGRSSVRGLDHIDPLNYIDAADYVKYRWDQATGYTFEAMKTGVVWSSQENIDEVSTIWWLVNYNGVPTKQNPEYFTEGCGQNKPLCKRGVKQNPWVENVNPYIQLQRAAVNEYLNQGPNYLAFKEAFLESGKKGTPSPQGLACEQAIINLYKSQGWSVSVRSDGRINKLTKQHTFNGKTFTYTMKRENGRFGPMAYWSGKIAQEKIMSILNKS